MKSDKRIAAGLLFIIPIVMVNFSCTTFREEQPINAFYEEFAKIPEEETKVNALMHRRFELALPEGWMFVDPPTEEKDSVLFHLDKRNVPSHGKYEIIDLEEIEISERQAEFLFVHERHRGWKNMDTYNLDELNSGLHAFYGQTTRNETGVIELSFYRFQNKEMHLLAFYIDQNRAHAQRLFNHVVSSYRLSERARISRVRKNKLSYIGTVSSFRWRADGRNGLILQGPLSEHEALVYVSGKLQGKHSLESKDMEEISLIIDNHRVWTSPRAWYDNTSLSALQFSFTAGKGKNADENGYHILCSIDAADPDTEPADIIGDESFRRLIEYELFLSY